jgi:hypothetical protein
MHVLFFELFILHACCQACHTDNGCCCHRVHLNLLCKLRMSVPAVQQHV